MRILVLTLLAAGGAFAQGSGFESASIKLNTTALAASYSHVRPDNLDIRNETLLHILSEAFEMQEYQIKGPEWMRSEHFDIVAKAPLGEGNSGKKLFAMLRTLVVERFRIETHRETRDFPAYALVVAKGGLKLREAAAEGGSTLNSNGIEGDVELTATRTSMAQFAKWIARTMDRPVVDMTGTPGVYAFTLKYAREDKGETATMTHPVLALAIQEQLGLRLEKRTMPLEVLAIDRVERAPVED